MAERVGRILSGQCDVVERTMMGGLAFIVNGSMCCSVGRDALLVRVGAEGRQCALAYPHVSPMKIGDKTMSGFVRVDSEGFRTDSALAKWLARGIEAGAARARGTCRPMSVPIPQRPSKKRT